MTDSECARRGASLLDTQKPGWAARIDVASLDMSDCRRCLLGQLFRGFGNGAVHLDLVGTDRETGLTKLAVHGFVVFPFSWWPQLDAAWRVEIDSRLVAEDGA